MVSYYNSLTMYPKNPCTNLYPAPNHWYAPNYHQPPNAQLFGPDSDAQAQPMYYTHHAMFHQGSPDWPSHDNFSTPQNSLLHQSASSGASSGTPGLHLSHGASGGMGQASAEHISTDGLTSIPSPPITVSGSEMSSPGAPNGAGSPHTVSRPAPVKSPYEWMKKTSYQNQTNPGRVNICSAPSLQDFSPLDPSGKTRTKDKYRVVYTDFQRLELEKEYHTSKYITIRRKTELAQSLSLSERQVKIWFQNRRAKERKQTKKHESNPSVGQNHSSGLGIMETKPKIEPLHLQHPALHQMSAMSMSMGPMSLHAHSLHHSHFGMTPPPPSTPGQHLHGPQVSQPAASAGALI